MTAEELKAWLDDSKMHVLIDLRLGRAYTTGHVPGALSAPYRQHGWAEMVADWAKHQNPSVELGLFGDNAVIIQAASDALQALGIAPAAAFDGGLGAWQGAGYPVVAVRDLTVDELASSLGEWTVIDVREPYELRSGVIPGAQSIPMGSLEQHAATLPKERQYAMVCASGSRSQSAAAYLAEQGYRVANVVGGMSLWLGAGHPTE